MRPKTRVSALLLAAVLALPAQAAENDPFAALEPLLTPQALFGGVIRERDVSLLFDHLRAAMLAAAEGREAPPMSDELGRRLETVGGEMRLRGTLAGLALSQVLERALRESVRELAQPAPRGGD